MTSVNYVMVYFKYPVSTLINGELTNKMIKRLEHEIRANANSVDIDFGGGNYGYPELYLSDVEYT